MTGQDSGTAITAPTVDAPASPSPPVSPTTAPITPFRSLSDTLREVGTEPETGAPAEPATLPEGDAPATAAPAAEPTAVTPGEKKGPIPFDVHHTALENARTKTEEKLRSQYSEAITFAEQFNANPVATVVHLVQSLQQHPQYGQALRSEAGRLLAAQRQRVPSPAAAPEAVPEPQPDVRVQYEDGTEGRTFSPEQLKKWQTWHSQTLKQEIGQQFAPLRTLQERLVAAQQLEQQTASFVENAQPYVEELRAMPGFADHLKDIAAKQQELFAASPQANPMTLWFRAYREVVPAKLQAKHTEQLAASALEASAGRSPNPATVSTTTAGPPRSLQEAFVQHGLR